MRDRADWRSALLTLPDGAFFDLMRSYLGDIRTPFNKQRLVAELEAFLSRDEVRSAMDAYLAEEDCRLLAAVELLAEPTVAELSTFFDGAFSYAELHALLLNLEERLLIYRFADESGRRVAVTPVFEAVVQPRIGDPGLLFPSEDASAAAPPDPEPGAALGDAGLGALVSYILGGGGALKTDGSLRKKVDDELAALFPDGSGGDGLRALRSLGAVYAAGDSLAVDGGRLASLATLSGMDRRLYLAAALILGQEDEGESDAGGRSAATQYPAGSSWGGDDSGIGGVERSRPVSAGRSSRERIAALARLLLALTSDLDPGRIYPAASVLRRFTALAFLEEGSRSGSTQARFGSANRRFEALTGRVLDGLRTAGLVAAVGEDAFRLLPLAHSGAPTGPTGPESSIVVDPSFSVIVYPELPFVDALSIAAFLEAESAAGVVRYELTRASAIRGFDASLSPGGIAAVLERLSARPLPQNIRFSLEDWYRRYSSASLHRGLVLVLDEDRRFLAQGGPLSRFVSRVLAPGVYLLAQDDEAAIVQALAKAGVDVVARPDAAAATVAAGASFVHFKPLRVGRAPMAEGRSGLRSDGGDEPSPAAADAAGPASRKVGSRDPGRSGADPLSPSVPPQSREGTSPLPASRASGSAAPDGATSASGALGDEAPRAEAAEERMAALRAALDAKRLPKDQREELAARIRRRVVLVPSQLAGAAVRYEKLEAKGLDYVGKVRVAEQALAASSLLEVYWRGSKGQGSHVLALPVALERSGGEVELLLDRVSADGFSGSDAEDSRLRLPLGKISLLRRVRRSIFGE